jgi:tripeptide aminopeptidase
VERTVVRLLVRDFAESGLADKERAAEEIARQVASRFCGRVSLETRQQYRNMREVLDRHPMVVSHAAKAIARVGLAVLTSPIRGGTDGSRLSFMGLPTPNLFAGQHNIHSRLEWTSRQDMEAAVRTIIVLCGVWEEES